RAAGPRREVSHGRAGTPAPRSPSTIDSMASHRADVILRDVHCGRGGARLALLSGRPGLLRGTGVPEVEVAMLDVPVMTTLAVGLVLGLRHALDADHIAAVAALGGPGGDLRRALANGLSWGFGHALTIGVAGFFAIALRSA